MSKKDRCPVALTGYLPKVEGKRVANLNTKRMRIFLPQLFELLPTINILNTKFKIVYIISCMSHLRVTEHSLATSLSANATSQSCCCNNTILKISLIVFGLFLIGGAIASYIYQVNAIAVYVVGGVGALLILATVITSIVQCMSRRRAETRVNEEEQRQFEAKQRANEEECRWYELAQNGDVNTIKEALKYGTLPEPTQLLQAAAKEGHAELVSLLLENGADPKLTSRYDHLGYSALHLAAICYHHQKGLDTMRVLLAKDATLASVNAKEKNVTPLHLAASGGAREDRAIHRQKVELLIQHGADVNAIDSKGNTPLHMVAHGITVGLGDPNIEVIEILVNAGAQWSAKNKKGKTPLQVAQKHHAAWCNKSEIQQRLSVLSK
jgi:hypothetical protein